ncbi:COP9 signalosome complex subunit 4 [Geranomyces variabilis]|nr:COP9 signalosome complex subunit 4 [Geranomyces variabilis]
MSLSAQLSTIAAAPDTRERATLYRNLILSLLAACPQLQHDGAAASQQQSRPLQESIREVLTHAVAEGTGLVTSRQILQDFVTLFGDAAKRVQEGNEAAMEVVREGWEVALAVMQPRAVAFEEQISTVREHLAMLYESAEEWSLAAQMLQGIPLESGHRAVPAAYKLRIYIQIVRLLLEADDAVAAEAYLNRAALLLDLDGEPTPIEQQIHFKSSQARILDQKRSFLLAAAKYHELSYMGEIHETAREQLLQQAVTCAVLAGAGPQRSRMLATLYKDDRLRESRTLASSHDILQKMYLGRVLRTAQVADFATTLAPHQLARLPDGSTVLDRAVTDHNLLAASNIYNNITFDQLATLLGISPENAEKTAARMIGDGNLKGEIDQIDRLILFGKASRRLVGWDEQVAGLCHHVDGIVESIGKKYPEWLDART